MDMRFVLHGITFVWDHNKAVANLRKHGIACEQAAEAFFDPFLKLVDASREEEARDAIIGHGHALESALCRPYRAGGGSNPHHLSSEGNPEGAGRL